MSADTATPARPPLPPPRALPPPATRAPATPLAAVRFGQPAAASGHRVVLYGPGGIGKTTLAAQAPAPVVFIDLDESLSQLRLASKPQVVTGVSAWQTLRDALRAHGWDGIKTIVIDTATRAEELAVAHTVANVRGDKGATVANIEGYGYGKGYSHLYDTFLPLLADLDAHCRAGRNVILICHDCTATVPNPAGEDYLRYEPRLSSPKSGKDSIRLRLREWADHLLFIGYDVAASKEGKGAGSGTRTLYATEFPHCMAKSRTCPQVIALTADAAGVTYGNGVPLWDCFIPVTTTPAAV